MTEFPLNDMPSYMRTIKWDTNRDDTIDNIKTVDYWTDENGNVFREFAQTDSDNNGKIDFTETVTRKFNDNGFVTSELTTFDNLTNDELDQSDFSEYRYNDDGGLVWFRSSSDYRIMGVNADGVWDSIYTQETTLDDHGRVVETFSYTDWDADNRADTMTKSVYRYDDDGFQIFAGHDYSNDGTFNYTDEVVFYDLA